ncbi:FecCD family ABC transporter permease [Prauserella muralis]|uniref:ABC transporter permease n=1 Tax=Prauserella muralis TaxID=588067 RepID=A0A2V4AK38_9PSEU|nr:iron ABC transporter permease [Prauserella muralis]PXY20648.1 ABC transporter permease [Prauserella muralis]TWE29638.1 iron complex transport system permease protein [Prauserella muralis]
MLRARARQGATTRLRPRTVVLAALVLLAVAVFGVVSGAGELGWQRVLGEIVAQLTGGTSPLSEREAAIVWELRAPRVVLAALVGAALAGAGAAFQGVFRNPLADPYLLGAAAGAGMAATVVLVFAPAVTGWLVGPLPLAAFAGALGGVGLSWVLGRSAGGSGTASLLLAGVAVTAFLTAIQTFVQQLNTDTIKQVYTWTLGGLNVSGWDDVGVALPYIVLAAIVLCACGRLLDVLALGDAEAASLGIRPGRVRLLLLAAASLATAAAVAVSGLIGFVGIVVPHIVRLLAGASYRVIVPLSLLGGATFLIAADYVARTVLPGELPLGVVTAFAGAPFFAIVLRTSRGRLT